MGHHSRCKPCMRGAWFRRRHGPASAHLVLVALEPFSTEVQQHRSNFIYPVTHQAPRDLVPPSGDAPGDGSNAVTISLASQCLCREQCYGKAGGDSGFLTHQKATGDAFPTKHGDLAVILGTDMQGHNL